MVDACFADEIFDGIPRVFPVNKRVPVATYRLQFQPTFTFDDVKRLVPYLHELGISDCYASPILQAASSGSHGYDISHHNLVNPELGAERGFNEFAGELKRHEMGLILDWVPNHMGIVSNTNAWWLDILEKWSQL